MCKKLQILMDFHYTEKRKSIYWDESIRRRHTLTLGSSIEQDIDTHSVYGFETPMMEHRKTAAANGKSHSFPYLCLISLCPLLQQQCGITGLKFFQKLYVSVLWLMIKSVSQTYLQNLDVDGRVILKLIFAE